MKNTKSCYKTVQFWKNTAQRLIEEQTHQRDLIWQMLYLQLTNSLSHDGQCSFSVRWSWWIDEYNEKNLYVGLRHSFPFSIKQNWGKNWRIFVRRCTIDLKRSHITWNTLHQCFLTTLMSVSSLSTISQEVRKVQPLLLWLAPIFRNVCKSQQKGALEASCSLTAALFESPFKHMEDTTIDLSRYS